MEEVDECLDEEQMEEHEDDISRKKDLCKLAAYGKLAKKFRIAELKNICESLDIHTGKFKRRKAPYNEAFANVLNSCT